MNDILIHLVDHIGQISLAVQSMGEHLKALEKTVLFHYPELEDDFDAQLDVVRKENQQVVEQLKNSLSALRKSVSDFPS